MWHVEQRAGSGQPCVETRDYRTVDRKGRLWFEAYKRLYLVQLQPPAWWLWVGCVRTFDRPQCFSGVSEIGMLDISWMSGKGFLRYQHSAVLCFVFLRNLSFRKVTDANFWGLRIGYSYKGKWSGDNVHRNVSLFWQSGLMGRRQASSELCPKLWGKLRCQGARRIHRSCKIY